MNDFTLILNCYRRPYYLKEQLDAIKRQTVQPKEIWLWINTHEDNQHWDFSDYGFDVIVRSSRNFIFHGRFGLACLARTKYIALLDDDTIPGENWFKSCIDIQEKQQCILGGAGVTFTGDLYYMHDRHGWPSENETLQEVDLVGHAWFFPSYIMRTFWIDTYSLDNCEDMQVSFTAQKYFNLKTYCPPHPKSDKSLWSSLTPWEKGNDGKASSATHEWQKFYSARDMWMTVARKNGWRWVKDLK